MPASVAIFATRSAIMRAWDSDSITQGPAIRNSGLLPPRRREPKESSRVVVISERKIPQPEARDLRCSGGRVGRCAQGRGVGLGLWRDGAGRGARLLDSVFQ